MDLFSQAQPSSELMLYLECSDDHQGNLPAVEGSHLGSLAPHLPPSGTMSLTSDIMTGQRFAALPANYTVNWSPQKQMGSDDTRYTNTFSLLLKHFD